MAIWFTGWATLTNDTAALAVAEAVTDVASFSNVPEHGVIMSAMFQDLNDTPQEQNIDMVLFNADIAGTATNSAFAPSDVELLDLIAYVSFTNFKTFSANGVAVEDNIGHPYWTPGGVLSYQLVCREGTPTYAAANSIRVALGIVY